MKIMSEQSVEQKRLLALVMHHDGRDMKDIASELNVSKSFIRRARCRLQRYGHLMDRPRAGRPSVSTDRDKRMVKYKAVRQNCYSAQKMSRELRDESGVQMNRQQVSQELRRCGFKRYGNKFVVEPTKRWTHERKKFYDSYHGVDWKRVAFSDEKVFDLSPDNRVKLYARSYEEAQKKYKQQPDRYTNKVKVWGIITAAGVGPLIAVEQNMNSEGFRDKVLQKVMATRYYQGKLFRKTNCAPARWLFQQDNASFHKGPSVRKFFKEHQICPLVWPPRSPDLNPIENIWSIVDANLKRNIVSQNTSMSPDQIYEEVLKAWNMVTSEQCNAVVGSMPSRLAQLKKGKYCMLKY